MERLFDTAGPQLQNQCTTYHWNEHATFGWLDVGKKPFDGAVVHHRQDALLGNSRSGGHPVDNL